METTTTTKTKEIFTPEEFDEATYWLESIDMAAIAYAFCNCLIDYTGATKKSVKALIAIAAFTKENFKH